ncbi:MAG: T9SS type A sorting domain-containing protein, partial [Saprospiraceae bacterium]
VDPGAFDYLLINAVQEIKQEKDAEIKALQAQVEQLATQLTALQMTSTTQGNTPTTESSSNLSESIFIKNHPNPFTESTTIDYEIPNHSSNANIHITKLDGELVQTFPIQGSKGSVTLTNQLLSAGMYIYSIEIAGRVVASEKMLLTK